VTSEADIWSANGIEVMALRSPAYALRRIASVAYVRPEGVVRV